MRTGNAGGRKGKEKWGSLISEETKNERVHYLGTDRICQKRIPALFLLEIHTLPSETSVE